MAELDYWKTGMITIHELAAGGMYPVTLTFEHGVEVHVHVSGIDDVEALAKALDCTWAILYRGRSWIQMHA